MYLPPARLLAACFLVAALPVPLAACMPEGGNVASRFATPPTFDAAGQTKCGVRKSADHPLIVEWPSADRATLEAKAQSGLVAVRYVGCEMEVLHRCKLPGKYAYTSITPKHDSVTIKDADDLYANMPVGAAKLEGKLEKTGQLNVSMTIVGRFEADHATFGPKDLDGEDCDRATHVVSGMTTGAFELSAGATANVGGGATVLGAGLSGKSSSSHETLERDGHEEKCEGGSRTGEPPDGCGAVLRLDLEPLAPPKRERSAAAPGDADTIAGNLYETGNLRVAAFCAESPTPLTPDQGLRVLADGKTEPEKAVRSNLMSVMGTQTVNNHAVPVVMTNVTDVGFVLPPGPHHLNIQAPDCAPLETDVTLSGTHETNVTADLDVTAMGLKGPVGSPAGLDYELGAFGSPLPTAVTKLNGVGSVNGAPMAYGGVFGMNFERRNLVIGLKYALGPGSFSGVASDGTSFTGSQFENYLDIRAGVRIPLQYVAFKAGAGLGGSMWISSFKDVAQIDNASSTNLLAGGVNVLWDVPLWAAIEIKPVCNFGLEIGAAYNWDPTSPGGSSPLVDALLMYQPAPACSRSAGVNVSP